MKNLSFSIGAALLLLLLPILAPAETPPPEVLTAAEAGLSRYLSEIPPEELVNLGFPPGADLLAARVGEPWPLYTITPDALLSAAEDTDVETLVSPTGLWYFPVILDGSWLNIITVDRMEGEWEAVALGRAPLASELEKITRQWPKANGYTPKLVAVYQAAAYFFTVPEKNTRNFTPLTFDGIGFGGYLQKSLPEYSATADLSELLAPLKEAVEVNIAAHRAAGKGGEE
ncbi:MAG: hypothetical protein P9M08_13235 [Candidatus Erginobacter occultus]|nr:hypothetical protein [Candidatus Erginobacter occultus]